MVMRGRFETDDGIQERVCQVIPVHPKSPSTVCAVEGKECMYPWVTKTSELQEASQIETLTFIQRLESLYSLAETPTASLQYNKLLQLRKICGKVGKSVMGARHHARHPMDDDRSDTACLSLVWTCWVTHDQLQQCVVSFSPENESEILTLPTEGDEGMPTYQEQQAFWHALGVRVRLSCNLESIIKPYVSDGIRE